VKKNFTEEEVVEHLRDYRCPLLLMHVVGGKAWFVPGLGHIDDDVAHLILARLDIQGVHAEQWPGIAQVFVYRRAAA
jgi:hypothetical protein